jgi:transcriptional regulator with XRE-family HTH domain
VTTAQLRAARGLLNWTVRELAERVGVHRNTITNFETGKYADPKSLNAIRDALEAAGVEFTNGKRPGVRLRVRETH